MSKASKGFARLINPGVILGPELGHKINTFEAMNAERSDIDGELVRLRKEQEEAEDSLAEALAEDELQYKLRPRQMTGPNEEELQEILRRHLSGIINKLTSKYERILYLDADIRKLKQTIEKEIAAANQESADAASSM